MADGLFSTSKQSQKGGLKHNMNVVQLLAETMQMELKKVYTRYNQIKQDPNSQDTWIGQLIEVQGQSTGHKKQPSGSSFRVRSK